MDILTVSRKIELLLRSLTSPTALYSDSVPDGSEHGDPY